MWSIKFLQKYKWKNEKKTKALTGFEPVISCLLDRRFNQLSHRAIHTQHAITYKVLFTDGFLYTEQVVFPHFIRELFHTGYKGVLEMNWDQCEYMSQPRVFKRSYVISVNSIVDVVQISLQWKIYCSVQIKIQRCLCICICYNYVTHIF